MNITLLNFSPRDNGNCGEICRCIQLHHQNANIRLYNVGGYVSPCADCDYECLKNGERCPNVTERYAGMMDTICRSELVYYVIPNFCGMPNAVYYAFNERSVGYFNMDRAVMGRYMAVPKKFIIVSNTENAVFADAMRQQTEADPDILYLKTSRYQKKSIAGDMMESEEAWKELKRFLGKARKD